MFFFFGKDEGELDRPPTLLRSSAHACSLWSGATKSMSAKQEHRQLSAFCVEENMSWEPVLEYLHDDENQLHHWKRNLYGGIAVDVAHVAGDFEDVHDDAEKSEEHQASWSSRTRQTLIETVFVNETNPVLTPEPHRPSVAVFVINSILLYGCVGNVIDHPDGGEDEENNEEELQVGRVDVDLAVSAAADQGAAEDQDVDAEDPGHHRPPVVGTMLQRCASVPVGLAGVLRLIRSAGAVGQMSLLCLLVFDRHPAGLTGIAVGQTPAGKAAVQTHSFLLSPPGAATQALSGLKGGSPSALPFIDLLPPPKLNLSTKEQLQMNNAGE